ncbi:MULTISPECIES: hypothetical protein [Rhodococcus]|uniref:hypothetical protein n=1 Tax=Rhodococcus TaxID=1827 RepID=UPI001ED8CE66|nr:MULTISPECIES: hypothetical protein [Rhodococcus]
MAIAHAAKRNADVLIHLGDFGYAFTYSYLEVLDRALDDRLGRVTDVAKPAHPRAEELTERAGTGQSASHQGRREASGRTDPDASFQQAVPCPTSVED